MVKEGSERELEQCRGHGKMEVRNEECEGTKKG